MLQLSQSIIFLIFKTMLCRILYSKTQVKRNLNAFTPILTRAERLILQKGREIIMDKQFKLLMYRSAEEDVSVNAVIKDESIRLTQKAMAELFGCSTDNISLHLKNIFVSGELEKDSVTEKISATATDGKKYPTQFYNLDAIISVGYRVNSRRATNFRIWATGVLKEYMMKGFAMDDDRLKQGKTAFGKDYFRELLERVRSIRASERRIWQQIRQLERAVTGYFDYIEDLIERKNTFTMEEFAASVNEFLAFRRYDILRNKGSVSHQAALKKAETEYEAFNKTQKITSDFDKEVKKLLEKGI